jgi:hypothetical protein
MKSSAFATTGARTAAGRHAGPRQEQGWLTAGLHAHGRHAQGRQAPGPQARNRHEPDRHGPDRHTVTRPAGAFARRLAVSAGAAAMAAIGLPETI